MGDHLIKAGSTSVFIGTKLRSSTTGQLLTAIVASNVTCTYNRIGSGTGSVNVTTGTIGTWGSGTLAESPLVAGSLQFCPPNVALVSGVGEVHFKFTYAGALDVLEPVTLTGQTNGAAMVSLGVQVPNATAGTPGGLLLVGSNAGSINPSGGVIPLSTNDERLLDLLRYTLPIHSRSYASTIYWDDTDSNFGGTAATSISASSFVVSNTNVLAGDVLIFTSTNSANYLLRGTVNTATTYNDPAAVGKLVTLTAALPNVPTAFEPLAVLLNNGAMVGGWNGTQLTTGIPNSGTATVGAYSTGQDPATYILVTPTNKLGTDSSNRVVASSVSGTVGVSTGIAAGGITAASIVASALNDKGNWLLLSAYTAPSTNVNVIQWGGTNATLMPAAVGSAMTLADNAIGNSTFLNGAITSRAIGTDARTYLYPEYAVATGTTIPAVAGVIPLFSLFNGQPTFINNDTSVNLQINVSGTNWQLLIPGAPSHVWVSSGTNVSGTYTPSSNASGTVSVAVHGNASLSATQYESPALIVGGFAPGLLGTGGFLKVDVVNTQGSTNGASVPGSLYNMLNVGKTAFTAAALANAPAGGGDSGGTVTFNVGPVVVDWNYGGKDMRVLSTAGGGLSGKEVFAYVASEYAADPNAAAVRGYAVTNDLGQWFSMGLSAGVTYTMVADPRNGTPIKFDTLTV